MTSGKASRTALRVATNMLTLNEKPGWPAQLPAGMVAATETLLLRADIPGFGRDMIEKSKSPKAVENFSRYETRVPGMFEGLGRRKIFMEAQFDTAMTTGIRQVAVIGAGFDTLCIRRAAEFPGVSFVEIDHPDTQSAKRHALTGMTPRPANLHLIPADLSAVSVIDTFMAAETAGIWQTNAPALFIVEGLLMYLNRAEVSQLFNRLAVCAGPGTRIAFSHLNSLKRYFATRLIVRFMGEPWRSASEPGNLATYLPAGWTVTERHSPASARELEGFALAEKC